MMHACAYRIPSNKCRVVMNAGFHQPQVSKYNSKCLTIFCSDEGRVRSLGGGGGGGGGAEAPPPLQVNEMCNTFWPKY